MYEEGALIFPAVKVQEDYETNLNIVRMCRMRIRVPDQWWGDFLAMVGAARIGERELLALGAEVGWDALAAFTAQWFDYSEARMAAAIAAVPAGTARWQSTHDAIPGTPEDGITVGVVVTTEPQAGTVTVDLRDNPDCLPCGLNLSEACSRTAAMVGVLNALDHTVPKNAGAFRRVDVRLREGCVVGIPRHPASCSVATTNVADRVANSVQAALAELADGIGLAECGAINPPSGGIISGIDPRSGAPFVNQVFIGKSCGAAAPAADAWQTIGHVGNGGLCYLDSVELDELRHPIYVHARGFVADTEGAGRHRGASAIYSEYGPLACAIDVVYNSDGNINAPKGVRGGLADRHRRHYVKAKVRVHEIPRRHTGRLSRTSLPRPLPGRRRADRTPNPAGRVIRFDATGRKPCGQVDSRSAPDHFPTGPTATTEAVNSSGTYTGQFRMFSTNWLASRRSAVDDGADSHVGKAGERTMNDTAPLGDVPIDGHCEPQFAAVRDIFAANMNTETAAGREVGACVSLVLDGVCVVDLWGGYRDAARTLPWQRDTITCMMSVAKASASVCVHVLAERGAIDYAAPVADYWPEFAQNGKAAISVRTLVSHQGAVLYADAAPVGSLWQPGVVERALEAQAPAWEAGTAGSYHSFTYGPLMEGLVRRVSGRTVGQFFRAEVAEPLGLDYQIGLNDDEMARCAEYIETPGTASRDGIKENTESPLFCAWAPLPKDEDFNSDDWRRGEFASANGHGNARAIARLYGCLARGGEIDGIRLLAPETVAGAIAEHWAGMDRMTNRPFRFGTGFMLSCPPFPMGGGTRNFGHPGLGGGLGFGDPDHRLGFSYCGNRMTPIADEGPFAGPLIAACYGCL